VLGWWQENTASGRDWVMGNQETKSARRDVEEKWHSKLSSGASTEDFVRAYAELALFPDEKPRIGLTAVDRIILQKAGSGKRILEIGCGDGRLAAALAEQGNRVVGADISSYRLMQAKARCDSDFSADFQLVYSDARYLVFEDASFDYVISRQLIEHLSAADGRKHLREVHRLLRVGGCYLLVAPSRITKGYRSAGFHLWMYSLQEMVQLVSSLGFESLWIEPKLVKWLGIKRGIPSSWLPPVFWYEGVLDATRRIFFPNHRLTIRGRKIAPTVMLAAYKKSQ
jgi:SAM-dependent methyltransferase